MINTHVLILNQQLKRSLLEKKQELEKLTTHELIRRYNKHAKGGFFVSAQAVEVVGIHQLMMQRLGVSPITLSHGCVVTLNGEVSFDGYKLKTPDNQHFFPPQNRS